MDTENLSREILALKKERVAIFDLLRNEKKYIYFIDDHSASDDTNEGQLLKELARYNECMHKLSVGYNLSTDEAKKYLECIGRRLDKIKVLVEQIDWGE